MKPLFFFLLLISALPVLAQVQDEAPTLDWDNGPIVDLRQVGDDAGQNPLLFVPKTHFHGLGFHKGWSRAGYSLITGDFDNDGQTDFLRATSKNFSLVKITDTGTPFPVDEFNFPLRFHSVDPSRSCCVLQGPVDLDGDGTLEVLAMAVDLEGTEFGFWVISLPDLQTKGFFSLGSLPQRQPDSTWDGFYIPAGFVSGLLPDPEDQALILGVSVGFDVNGRGIMAVDPKTGEILWHFESGPKVGVRNNIRVVDLDGDGTKEIVYFGSGVGNMGPDEVLGDFGDSETRVFVLNNHGEEIWSQQVESGMSSGRLTVGDFSDHPGLEIGTASTNNQTLASKLSIWGSSGDCLDQLLLQEPPRDLHTTGRSNSSLRDLLISFSNGGLVKLGFDDDHLEIMGKALFSSNPHLNLAMEPQYSGFQPIPVFDSLAKTMFLLDNSLQPLASVSLPEFNTPHRIIPIDFQNQKLLLVEGYNRNHGFEIIPNPNALPSNPVQRLLATTPRWVWALVALSLLTMASWWLLVRKYQQVPSATPLNGDHKREARLHLLEDLELSGHGAMAPLRTFRRLLWLLDAIKTGVDFNDGMSLRFREIWADCHKEDIPRLLVILDRARQAQLEHPGILIASEALLEIQSLLTELKSGNFELEHIKQASKSLAQQGNAAEEALQELREEVGKLFQADLEQVVARVLRANEEQLKTSKIQVHQGRAMAAASGDASGEPGTNEPLLCRIDPHELGFIIDNLVSNATRAMEGCPECRLDLIWLGTNGLIQFTARDTGIGITEEDLEYIVDTPFTTKKSGGLGLHHSQRILRKYGGKISIKESSPGQGTTFQLLLPRARQDKGDTPS